MPHVICLDNITKTYGATVAVNGLSLEIEQGEIFGLLGPNGAGKSTTLYMLSGLVKPTSGTLSIFGKDLRRNFLEIIPRMGVLVERPSFYEHLTVEKNLLISSRLAGKHVTIDRALDLVGLVHLADKRVSTLSRGMRQRLGLAQAFLTEPELLILDEPTNAIDPEHALEIVQLLRRLSDSASVTIVISSHTMYEMETLCDRVAIINQGELVSCESTDTLLSYDTSSVEVLIDSPEPAARRLRDESWVESVEVERGRLQVHLNDSTPHHLNSFLVANGYKVSGLTPRRRTLQEYFLKALNT
ncbi:MAG: ABC transporter ATP-binding protein [Candidatus Hydrogenedentes bacterium]|nr:ABC transporter ATP-binding protein [Candidatus Hydrogenedentota bacterium]